MARFKNEDPLSQPARRVGEKAPDTGLKRSIDEVRDFAAAISHLLRGFVREKFVDRAGQEWEFVGRRSGTSPARYGFQVSGGADADTAMVEASVVSGMGASAAIPVIGVTPLDDDDAPILTGVPNDYWVALYLEVAPTTETTFISEDESTVIWAITEGGGTLVGDIEVKAYADTDAMDAAVELPTINPTTGAVVTNAKYVIPLAKRNTRGVFKQLGYSGPLGVRMCASGAMVALAPARGMEA